MEHAKCDWIVETEKNIRWLIKDGSDLVADCANYIKSEANAKRIVQCVNAHDGLLEACKDALKQANWIADKHEIELDVSLIEQTINKAEGN